MFTPTKWDRAEAKNMHSFAQISKMVTKKQQNFEFWLSETFGFLRDVFFVSHAVTAETTLKAITTYTAANKSENQIFLGGAIFRADLEWLFGRHRRNKSSKLWDASK